jgi:hypothetical protein
MEIAPEVVAARVVGAVSLIVGTTTAVAAVSGKRPVLAAAFRRDRWRFRAIKNDIAGWTPQLRDRKIDQLATIIAAMNTSRRPWHLLVGRPSFPGPLDCSDLLPHTAPETGRACFRSNARCLL